MQEDLEKEIQDMDIDNIEEMLFEERRSMVEFAEEHDQWQLFDDKQSIESMRESIQRMEDSDIKNQIMNQFRRVETLYDEYTERVVKDALQ